MKISKTLLAAIALGIAVQSFTSCKKEKIVDPKSLKEILKNKGKTVPEPCIACGMG